MAMARSGATAGFTKELMWTFDVDHITLNNRGKHSLASNCT